ncbi:hypothetical protein B2J88_44355 [Rhodococcus sp. SRB_17]|nr:hypothetical protein [Rhodococcus sp. SRB_17]
MLIQRDRYLSTYFDVCLQIASVRQSRSAYTCRSEVNAMTTLKDQLDNCQYLLARARIAGDDDAVRRFSERRELLVKQLASLRTHLRAV